MPRWPYPRLCSSFLCAYCAIKLALTKAQLCVLSISYTTACIGTLMICLHSIKSSLPSLYPLCHSCDKLSQAVYSFSLLQVTESWVEPGNKASHYGEAVKTVNLIIQQCKHSCSQASRPRFHHKGIGQPWMFYMI